VLDPFEELFTSFPERWRDRAPFFEQLQKVLDDDKLLRLVLVMREDYVAELDPYRDLLPERLRTRMRLERLHHDAALAAVTGPLRGARRFAPGVAEQLVEELCRIRMETGSGW
jgi:hypothetical protein